MLRRRFDAMGTQVELVLDVREGAEARDALGDAEAEIRRLERLLSRFDRDSELSRLNRLGRMVVSRDLLEVVELALAARDRTRGRFDPTVHDALVAAGYDRSFELVQEGVTAAPATVTHARALVRVHPTESVVELGPGARLDVGGIAKGYAADRAVDLLRRVGPCLADVGGDVAVHGRAWPIGVETTDGSLTVQLSEGGIATSGRDRRRWTRDGQELHHLIDPASGRPSQSDLLRVTAAAASAAEAETLATSLFLAGSTAAIEEADRDGIPAILVTQDGRTLLAGGIA